MLVYEFQSSRDDVLMVMVVVGMLAWRKMRGTWNPKIIDNPIFILAVLGWALGFVANRFWFDWGMVAIVAWMSLEYQDVFQNKIKRK